MPSYMLIHFVIRSQVQVECFMHHTIVDFVRKNCLFEWILVHKTNKKCMCVTTVSNKR